MQLLAALPERDDQIRFRKNAEMLSDCLPRHMQMPAKFAQGLAVVTVQLIQERTSAGISQCLKNHIHLETYATKWLHVNGH